MSCGEWKHCGAGGFVELPPKMLVLAKLRLSREPLSLVGR